MNRGLRTVGLLVAGLGMGVASGCVLHKVVPPLKTTPPPVGRATPVLQPGEIAVTWLGAAGALVRNRDVTIAFDPYVSRGNSLVGLVAGNLRPDEDAINTWIPHTDLVLIGHAHPDHMLDAPSVVKRDHAELVGSLTAVNIARSYGAPPRYLHTMGGGDTMELKGVTVHATRVDHLALPVIKRPSYGVTHEVRPAPLRASAFKDGGALFWRVVVDGIRIGHLSSPALPAHLPQNLDVDILLFSMAEKNVEPVLQKLLPATRPTFVMPIHWDLFYWPLEWDPTCACNKDGTRMVSTIQKVDPNVTVVVEDAMRERIFNVRTRTWR